MNLPNMDLKDPLRVQDSATRESVDPQILASLGRLARGLSALFWGLPLSLVLCVQTATGDWLRPLGIMPATLAAALLYYGLWQLGHFRPQERVWQKALDRAKIFSLLILGLAPFLYWWNQFQDQPFFRLMVVLLAASGLMLLFAMNPVLRRLAAMLPDETLRQETRAFTFLNRILLLTTMILVAVVHFLDRFNILPGEHSPLAILRERASLWLILFLILMPMAMVMALLWKTKEVILSSVFGGDNG